jgi:hypothetical protein
MVSYSPLLTPNCGTQQNPGAAAFYNYTLYYIGNGHDATIWILSRTCTADSLNPAEDPNDEQNYWTQAQLQNEPNFQNFEGGCGTAVPPACAVAGDYLYFVWIQLEGTSSHNLRVFATRLEPASGGSSMVWSPPVRLCGNGGSPLHITESNFAVTAWGRYLIGCYSSTGQTYLLVYDTSDWPSGGSPPSWNASAEWGVDLAAWPNFPSSYADLGGQISMDWFTPGGAEPGTASAAPAIYLIISFFNADKNEAYIWHLMDMTPFDQWGGGQPFKQWKVENLGLAATGFNVIRDPAGRMRAYSCDSYESGAIQYVTMATNQVSSDGYSWTTFGRDWELLYGSAGQQSADQAPIPAFVLGPSTTEQIQVASGTKEQTVRQVYEFLLFKNDGINLVFSHFGEAVRVADAYTLNFNEPVGQGGALEPGEKPRLVVTGIVDSPLPVPAANLEDQPVAGTLGSVDYGTTETQGDQRSTSWTWSAGFISEGYATDGAGPAWQISATAGMAGTTGHSDTTQLGTELISNTDAEDSALVAQGNYFHGGVIFHRDEYLFYDVNLDGTTSPTPVNTAPTITAIWISYTGLSNDSLKPYANTVGDLSSYTRAGWNARMQQLGYSGNDYFGEVILAQDKDGNYVNAVVLGAEGTPYLEFSWSTSGAVIQQFNDVSTSFEESGWHMEASVYGGYSFDVGASIFGVGEKEFGELLVGGSYSRNAQTTTTEGKSWGITVNYAPPTPPSTYYDGQVTAFSWKLYLLKANQQWTKELLAYGDPTFKEQIDPNSKPWRIVLEVDPESIVYRSKP